MGRGSQRERLPILGLRLGVRLTLALLVASTGLAERVVCARCHPKEVTGYSKFGMARSLREAGREPSGEF